MLSEAGGSRLGLYYTLINDGEWNLGWRTLDFDMRLSTFQDVWTDLDQTIRVNIKGVNIVDVNSHFGQVDFRVHLVIVSSASIETSSLDLNTAYIAALN